MKPHASITAKDVAALRDISIKTAEKEIRAVKSDICKDNAKPTFEQYYTYYGYELPT